MRVSVVVPTYRRPELLDRCLAALAHQRFAADRYEIIVVDDANDAATARAVAARALKSVPTIRYLPVTGRHGPAAARNVGWRAARGAIIAFTDDDTVPQTGWLGGGVRALAPGVDAVWGRLIVPVPPEPTDFERETGRLAEAQCVTANCFYWKTALEAVGGFDERFTTAWREDSDLFFSLVTRGGRVVHAQDAVVIHPVRRAPWGISISQQRKSMFNALLYKKHPRLYRQRIQGQPPWRYYLIVVAAIGGLFALAQGAVLLALGALAGWLLLTWRFFTARLRHTSRQATHVLEMALTSAVIPPLSIFWRLRGAVKYRVFFI